MSYPITDIEGIDGNVAAVLKSAGIRSTDRLLEAARTVKGRKTLAAKTGFDEKQLLCWANVADRMRIKGIRRTLTSRRCGHCERTQIPESAQSREGDGRCKQKAQSRAPAAIGEGGQTVDRERQNITAQDYLLMH